MNNSHQNSNPQTTIKILNYQITETVYSGSRTIVFRGIRTNDQLPVVIKLLKNDYPTFSELVQFRNQYTIAKNLHSPLIIQTYSLESYQNSYALVMEDFGGISLQEWGLKRENRPSLSEVLEIAITLCNALEILYRERIIHKDIKPSNILINPETKQVKLIDFSIASLLPKETQTLINPNVLEGTLAYISPEQTGRMNRGIDYRTDFYSLGITFYELLTGKLPFESNDPMELVHCHLAKIAPSINEINPEIPSVLSKIVNKLIAKNAESRYQSILGLKYDLENCLSQLQKTGDIQDFEIARRDVGDRFLIPDKLYGRETEIETLLQAFERVSNPPQTPLRKGGGSEMMLVAGFSGIGKTAVVNEVHKPIVQQRGYFIKGKYDQFQRNIPFSAFVQAFRDLMGQLLTESDAQIQQWKSQILEAVGENGQVIIEVIPELERIIGQQPPAVELSGNAAQNRFNLLFQKFTQVFTSIEHPLVMFLDDLQWADSASLKLMQVLMVDTHHLLLIGAYRDNEVNPGHPLILTLSEIQKTAATINTITLAPLSEIEINQLIADTLKCNETLALPLSQLVFQKTKGNPFFATQFLKALHQEKLIKYDFNLGCWQCDMAQINQQALTDDVVEFMALQLEKLPSFTQDILKLGACIGNEFDLGTLAIVSEHSEVETAAGLWKALQEGLVLPQSEVYKFYVGQESQTVTQENQEIVTYKFLHDRVQQAAYSLIPNDQKQATHLKIGQLLQQNYSEIAQEEKLFDIVGHLNQGQELIIQEPERETLAKLNLKAGQKARNSTAYTAAKIYLQIGIELLAENCWQNQYELTLNLYVAAAEVAYLNADLDNMEQMAALVLQEAQTILDKVKIYQIKIIAQIAKGKMLEGLAVARDALLLLGFEFPAEADEATIGKALQTLASQQSTEIEELIELPVMKEPQTQAAMQLLGMLPTAIFQGMPGLMPILSATMVSLSLQFGNAPESAVGYVIHGMVISAFGGEVETGYRFGRLALKLLDRFNAPELKCMVLLNFGGFLQHRRESLRAMMPTVKDGYMAGMETGDFTTAGYCISNYINANLFSGVELETLEAEIAVYREVFVQVKQDSARAYMEVEQQMVQNLRATQVQSDCLIGDVYDETVMLPKHHQDSELTAIAFAYIYKLFLAYFFGNYTSALNHSAEAKKYLMAVSDMVFIPIFHFYAALTYLAQLESEQAEVLASVETHQTILHQWAKNAPMNYLHKWYLVEAERQRVLGNKVEAIDLYDRAISLAQENQFINEEALANELAAKFYLDWGKEQFAQIHIINAYYCYSRWGAKAKVNHLETTYPKLLQPILQQQQFNLNTLETITFHGTLSSTRTISTGSTSISDVLDFTSVLKAAQVLSSSLELDPLVASLSRIIIENSGAKKAALLLPQDDTWLIKAITLITQGKIQTILEPQSLNNCSDIPLTVINYVKNTKQTVVIDNCQTDIPGLIGEYMLSHQPQSVLCTAIMNQGNLVGILYLENKLVSGVFTGDRLSVINLLSSQAAISLENARLYQQSQQSLQDLQQAQLQLVQSEKMSALGNLIAGVGHEINNPLGFIAASLELTKPTITDIFEHLKLYQESLPSPSNEIIEHSEEIDLDYSLEDLPKMLDSMTIACDRLKNISTSLRTFSRADKDYKVPFNIHEGINSTLLILKHRLKANEKRTEIEVITNYGDLPQVQCFPGQLNQVFMNIIANAIDTLDESTKGLSFAEIEANNNQIKITTLAENQGVKISITDNGQGMNEEVKQKIFEQGFTTKQVGKGTGLGLAIAHQIIAEKHGGTITCRSELGEGTEFILMLPLS
ncbi:MULTISPECIES: ATP-binding sensor histidine kinase [Spirulina sp. CCY15215]|uniref:ATP-binding sensor histidine kinase n=1 Tax=Spirulina sp. CCY15215 TaxID=2767591 RepID=UPI0019529A4A|nr:ATP-binding sensor histidine kinase [Spirulina major]